MTEPSFDFFEVVRVVSTQSPVVGREGAVIGISQEEESLTRSYLLYIDDETYGFDAQDLEATGRHMREEDFYDGSRVGVSPEGEVRWRTEPGEEPPPVVAG